MNISMLENYGNDDVIFSKVKSLTRNNLIKNSNIHYKN